MDTPDCLFLLLYRLLNARHQVLAIDPCGRVLKSVVGTIGSVQGMPVNSVRMTLIAEYLACQLKSRPVFRIPTAYLRLHYKAFSM